MSPSEKNKAAYRRFYREFMNEGDTRAVDELVATDLVSHDPLPEQGPGAKGLVEAISTLKQAFPDLHLRELHLLAENDLVVAHVEVTATHRGHFMGLPPTQRRVSYREVDLVRFDAGRIVEHWSVADVGALLAALQGAAGTRR
jgi:predicted ester cyclase